MAEAGAGFRDIRAANAFIWRQLRGSCAAGGASGTRFAYRAKKMTQSTVGDHGSRTSDQQGLNE
jgi:hypothetical protein